MSSEVEASTTVREPSSDCANNIEQCCAQLKTISEEVERNHPVDNGRLLTLAEQAAIWGRNANNRDILGTSGLLKVICDIIANKTARVEESAYVQCLRVVANACADHGDNRDIVLDSQCYETIISSLSGLPESNTIVIAKFVMATLNNLANDHSPLRQKLLSANIMTIIPPWLDPSMLDKEPDGDVVVVYTARLLFTLMEESGSILKFLQADGLGTIIPLAEKLLTMEDPSENPATCTVLDILQVLTALNETAQEAVGTSKLLYTLMNAIERRYINEQGDCIDEEKNDDEDDDNNNNDYKEYIVPVLIHVFSSDTLMLPLYTNEKVMNQLMRWIKSKSEKMATVGFLCLCNISRIEKVATGLLTEWQVMPQLHYWLKNSTEPSTKHAIIGLLRNMAVPYSNPLKIYSNDLMILLAPLVNHSMQAIYAKVIVLLKIMTRPLSQQESSNEECAKSICTSSSPGNEAIITRVYRLLETATDDTTKNESYRLIGHLIRYGWDSSVNANTASVIRASLLAHLVFPSFVEFTVTNKHPMLFNECLNTLTIVAEKADTFDLLEKEIFKSHTITSQAEPGQTGAVPPPTSVNLCSKIVNLLKENDPKLPIEYRSNAITFLDVFMHAGKKSIGGKL
ncbi:armadillo-type protein [Syncephalis plumigaleata]|nr:armadillo-type protein [Syncephalis plumigaleata]